MNIAVGCDHAGFSLKETVIKQLKVNGHKAIDLGTNNTDSVDYPDYAKAVAQAVISGKADRGIAICGSGIGACVTANKFKGIRAGIAHDIYSAGQGVEHDDMNVLCMGSRIIGPALASAIVEAYTKSVYSHEERHQRRLDKIAAIERSEMK